MSLFNKERTDGATHDGQGEERKGLIDVIKYNGEADELVWKFPYENISTAAQLVVNQSQEAVFVKGGAVCDVFGPGTKTLSANNIPILQKLVNLPFGGKTPFTAEVWFVSKTVRRNLKFGTSVPIELLDPLYNVAVPVRSFGEFGVQVTDSSALLTQMVGTLHLFTTEDIIEQFRSLIARKLSTCIGKFIVRQKVTVVEIGAYLDEVSNFVRDAINEEFAQYGLRITNFDVASVNFDKKDPNVQKILDSQSEAAKRRMEGYSYQQERQFDILQGAAQNEGGAGQMMGAGMGMGMGFGIGGMFGQQMGNTANVMNQQAQQAQPIPPSPPVAVQYLALINNVQQGPYDLSVLQQMTQNGQLTRQTYVWKAGMAQWDKAENCADLQVLFGNVPPPPPPPPIINT
ncbi:MAG: SPFH domain-containing protein [Prevotellaceae bacterium]|jgi:membrane protease subunit (stomatin/prohibitin family)|nr:SPFH domain-containing protein [Prevotellaceae bacterium]